MRRAKNVPFISVLVVSIGIWRNLDRGAESEEKMQKMHTNQNWSWLFFYNSEISLALQCLSTIKLSSRWWWWKIYSFAWLARFVLLLKWKLLQLMPIPIVTGTGIILSNCCLWNSWVVARIIIIIDKMRFTIVSKEIWFIFKFNLEKLQKM